MPVLFLLFLCLTGLSPTTAGIIEAGTLSVMDDLRTLDGSPRQPCPIWLAPASGPFLPLTAHFAYGMTLETVSLLGLPHTLSSLQRDSCAPC